MPSFVLPDAFLLPFDLPYRAVVGSMKRTEMRPLRCRRELNYLHVGRTCAVDVARWDQDRRVDRTKNGDSEATMLMEENAGEWVGGLGRWADRYHSSPTTVDGSSRIGKLFFIV